MSGIGIYREDFETKRDIIKGKINRLALKGDSCFALENNENFFEFKIVEVAGEPYKVFGGFGFALRVFHRLIDTESIIQEFEMALKGMDLTIDDCKFINPFNGNWKKGQKVDSHE